MIKICIPERNNLNQNILKKEFELVDNPYEADYILATSTVRFMDLINKTIYITGEPPRCGHRLWCYGNFKNFKAVFCFNPQEGEDNQFNINDEDGHQFYPTRPDPYNFITREDTKITNRGVFYAGNIAGYDVDEFGGIGIDFVRKLLGQHFEKDPEKNFICGSGFKRGMLKPDNWRENKHLLIEKSNCDFVLALENTIYPNYLYEKIWDGFATDRVTLYLGDPRIEHHIPTNCFVDLREYFDLKTKKFDIDALEKRLKEMTQEEYDEILNNARKFRETCKGKFRYYMDKLTNRIIKFIKDENIQKDL